MKKLIKKFLVIFIINEKALYYKQGKKYFSSEVLKILKKIKK